MRRKDYVGLDHDIKKSQFFSRATNHPHSAMIRSQKHYSGLSADHWLAARLTTVTSIHLYHQSSSRFDNPCVHDRNDTLPQALHWLIEILENNENAQLLTLMFVTKDDIRLLVLLSTPCSTIGHHTLLRNHLK